MIKGLLASLALTVAVATPPPLQTPAPAPLPPSGGQPVVLIYPFDVQTGADPKLGIAIAQILAQEMAAAGGITVLGIPQGVKRADFLETARSAKADFYVSGYVTPVGESAAVVEQVVSVDSGVILFSQTAQVTSVADVASQSLLARTQILSFVGRGTQNVEPQGSNTPVPTSTNGAQVPISGIGSIITSVFGHKTGPHGATPGPGEKPARGVIVAPVTASGAVVTADLGNATHYLYFALNRHYTTQLTAVTTPAAQGADQICGSNRDNTIAAGTLAETAPGHRQQFTFTLSVYTCFGATLEQKIGKGGSLKSAIDAAVTAYASAHPENS